MWVSHPNKLDFHRPWIWAPTRDDDTTYATGSRLKKPNWIFQRSFALISPFFLGCHTELFFFPKKLFCIFYGKPLKMCQKIWYFLFLVCWLSWDGSLIWLIFLWKHSLDFHSKRNQLHSSVGKYIPIFDTIKEHSHMTSYVLGLFLTCLLKYGNQILTLLH